VRASPITTTRPARIAARIACVDSSSALTRTPARPSGAGARCQSLEPTPARRKSISPRHPRRPHTFAWPPGVVTSSARDRQQPRRVGRLELVRGVVVVGDRDEVQAGLARGAGGGGRADAAVAVQRVDVEVAGIPGLPAANRLVGTRSEGRRRTEAAPARLDLQLDADAGRRHLVEAEGDVPFARRQRARPVAGRGLVDGHHGLVAGAAAPAAEGACAERERACLEQPEIHRIRPVRPVVPVRDRDRGRALGDRHRHVLVSPGVAVRGRAVQAKDPPFGSGLRRGRRERDRRPRGGGGERGEKPSHRPPGGRWK